MASNKREPTVFDQVIWQEKSDIVDQKTFDSVKNHIRTARKFVFGVDASTQLAKVIRDVPELLIREQMFARSPYDSVLIEIDATTLFVMLNNKQPAPGFSKKIAFLIVQDTVYTFWAGGLFTPLAYQLHQPWDVKDQMEFCSIVGTSRIQLDQLFWGSSYNNLDNEARRVLRNHNSAMVLPLNRLTYETKAYNLFYNESIGDLRIVIAALLLLNRPSLTRYVQDVPRAKTFHKGKVRQYFAHTTVSVDIDPVPTLKKIGTISEQGVEKRIHEVRGHWAHDEAYRIGTKSGCVHTWIPHPKYTETKGFINKDGEFERDNWLCTECNGHRWYRVHHMRGSALEGYVTKDYVAAANTDTDKT